MAKLLGVLLLALMLAEQGLGAPEPDPRKLLSLRSNTAAVEAPKPVVPPAVPKVAPAPAVSPPEVIVPPPSPIDSTSNASPIASPPAAPDAPAKTEEIVEPAPSSDATVETFMVPLQDLETIMVQHMPPGTTFKFIHKHSDGSKTEERVKLQEVMAMLRAAVHKKKSTLRALGTSEGSKFHQASHIKVSTARFPSGHTRVNLFMGLMDEMAAIASNVAQGAIHVAEISTNSAVKAARVAANGAMGAANEAEEGAMDAAEVAADEALDTASLSFSAEFPA